MYFILKMFIYNSVPTVKTIGFRSYSILFADVAKNQLFCHQDNQILISVQNG